jgi:uncharacterized protein (DUF983 family)
MDEGSFPVPTTAIAMRRGWSGRCPRCNKGSLFSSYLKMRSHCPVCAQALEPYRADDAPAYFTIVIVGHIVVPLVLAFEKWAVEPPLWLHALLWLPLSVALALLLLPRIKGAVIALLWTHRPPATEGPSPLPPSNVG